MNNDLSVLSSRELAKKLDDVHTAARAIVDRIVFLSKEHSTLINKKRVRPVDLIRVTKQLEDFKLAENLLLEYNKTLIDEQNRRKKEEETNTAQIPMQDSILEKLEKYFRPDYRFDYIREGYTIATTYAPDRKLQAVKEFKDLTKAGLKESKLFMDVAFDYIRGK